MANVKFAIEDDFIVYTINSVTSEDGDFVATNLIDFKKPKKSWRSTGTGVQQEIVLDLATAYDSPEIYIEFCNFTTIEIRGGTTPPTFPDTTGSLTITKDRRHGIYRLAKPLTFNRRYIQIIVPASQTTTDGASKYEIGSIVVIPNANVNAIPQQLTYPVDYREMDEGGVLLLKTPMGGISTAKLTKIPPFGITVNAVIDPSITSSDTVQFLWDAFRDKSKVVYVNFNNIHDFMAYLVYRVGGFTENEQEFNTSNYQSIELQVLT